MQLINNIDDSSNQTTHIVLSDGSVMDLTLQYLPGIQRWKYDIVYGDFEMYGKILCSHPNILRQFKNNIPFGMAITTIDGIDPFLLDDFTTGRASIYILDQSEVGQAEALIQTYVN